MKNLRKFFLSCSDSFIFIKLQIHSIYTMLRAFPEGTVNNTSNLPITKFHFDCQNVIVQ